MATESQLRQFQWQASLARWVHPSEAAASLFSAAAVGCIGGLAAIGFRAALEGVLWAGTRRTGSIAEVAAQLAWWQRLVIPAAGGLLAGLVLRAGARFNRGHRTTDYMEAVAVHPGAISLRRNLVKTLSSFLTITSGGSIGREGAMVQLSATLASWLAERTHLSVPRLRLMIACGAAGGLAAVYNVTVASALFVAEIVLGSIAVESLGPLLIAAVCSCLVSRYLGDAGAYFGTTRAQLASAWQLIPFTALAGFLGLAAPGYVWLLRRSEDWLAAIVPPVHWRMACGGLIVGMLAIWHPEVCGNGRSVVNAVLAHPWPLGAVALVLVLKTLATAATTGSGAVGGVFTPTLFTGAMLGCLFGHFAERVVPGSVGSLQTYALVGMGGFLAATTRAPLMSILMLAEMTLDYGLLMPLMAVCVLSYYTARSLNGDSIYSESLRRKQPRGTPAAISALRVRDLARPPPAAVAESAPFDEVARSFAGTPYRHLLVVGLQDELRGVVTIQDVEDHLRRRGDGDSKTAGGLMRTGIPAVTPDTELGEALEAFSDFAGERLPVVNNPRDRVLTGHITKTDVLLALAHGVSGSTH